MSGICGIIDWRGEPMPARTIERMAAAAAHRAVHGLHTWTSQHAHLAHLANHVTLEDTLEHQPLVNRDLVLVADARIDNRDELVPVLRSHLTSDRPTDADLILAAHRHWGDEAPAHLIGDFAYALWNTTTRTLYAARDPMAMRALYYHATPHRLIFATEIKQILTIPGVPVEIDEVMAGLYLTGPNLLRDRTLYAGIAQLAPAHALTATTGGHRTRRYWDIDPGHRIRYRNERDYTEHFLDIFKEAVRARTRSTRPIGILLSGGMDSGSVASTLGRLREDGHDTPPVHTYSWAFDELPGCDERHISNEIVTRYGFVPTDVPADEQWPLRDYQAYVPDRDNPFLPPYQALQEHSLDAARAHGVGPLLTGDHGDETVGDGVYDLLGMLGSGRIAAAWHDIDVVARAVGWSRRAVVRRAVLSPVAHRVLRARRSDATTRRPVRVPDFIDPALATRTALADHLRATMAVPDGLGPVRSMRYGRLFLVGGLLDPVPLERDCARRGLDLRYAWSDRRLASFVLAVPQWIVQRHGDSKRIARRAMDGIMPPAVVEGAGKIEPGALFDRGLLDRERSTVTDLFTNSQLAARGFVDEAVLRGHYQAMLRREPMRMDPWWSITMEMWLRAYWT